MAPRFTGSRPRRSAAGPALAVLVLALPVGAQETAIVAGRVLDDATGEPIQNAGVRLFDGGLVTLTDAAGRFSLRVPVGAGILHISHVSYGEHLRTIVAESGTGNTLDVSLTPVPVQLEEVVVEAPTTLQQRLTSSGNSITELRRPAIETAANQGLSLGELIEQDMVGVRVREGAFGVDSCVEYRGSVGTTVGECREMAVFLDGVPVSAPGAIYGNMPLTDIERIEALSPSQAGTQYGGSGGAGVLLIETRRGGVSEGGTRRTQVLGFDWDEERERYAWEKVFGGALLGNAVGLGLSYLVADLCFEIRDRVGLRGIARDTPILGIDKRCNPATTLIAGFVTLGLPGLGSTWVARWGGATDRSQGRILPGMVVSALSVAAGYNFVIRGVSHENDALTTTGTLMLTVGTPLLVTLSDRLFRALR